MNVIRELPHVLAVINAATISRFSCAPTAASAPAIARGIGAQCSSPSASASHFSRSISCTRVRWPGKFGGYGAIRPISLYALLANYVFMAFVVAVLVPVTFYNALKQRFATHKRLARSTFPAWLFVAVSGLVVYVMAIHLYPMNAS